MRRVVAAVASVVLGAVLLTGAAATPAPNPQQSTDPTRAAEYWLDQYGIREAWKTTRGAGQKIAIIDTGIARGPVEFTGAVAGGTDVSGVGAADGRTPVGAVDANHGSWVASLAASRGTGDQTGMIGVAPDAQLLSTHFAQESPPKPAHSGTRRSDSARRATSCPTSCRNHRRNPHILGHTTAAPRRSVLRVGFLRDRQARDR
ncbi:S8 family serine peptidase, partial [Microbacterium sp. B19]|uniref:S8 family serine peptidase n=1 Tax=Microbacterium sp. B19 TaxID=96765 RepID=UPI0003B329DC